MTIADRDSRHSCLPRLPAPVSVPVSVLPLLFLLPAQEHWPRPQHSLPLEDALTTTNPDLCCPRDLTDNQLTALPLAGLGALKHLKLKGNLALSQAFSKDSFPELR